MFDPTISEAKLKEIDKLCEDRLNVSYYKYGPARKNFGEGRVDAAGCIDLCLEKYKKTKNIEYMLDIINYARFKLMFPLPGDYFKATDSSESAGTVGTPINMER